MIIGIDIDNTLVTTSAAVLEYINERLGTNFTIEDIKEYYIENLLNPQYQWIVKESFLNKAMWQKVKPIKDAFETVEKLYDDGHTIYFCTSTEPENLRKKIKYISRHTNFSYDFVKNHMINIKDKRLVRLDILIDDYVENLIGDRTYFSLCLDYPWNRFIGENFTYDFKRVYNWKEIYNEINKIGLLKS